LSEMSPLVTADSAPAEATATKAAAPEAVAGEAAAAQDRAPLPPLDLSMLQDGTADEDVDMAAVPHATHGTDVPMPLPLPYLALYKAKMSYWGAYLVSQWGVARALSVPETSLMLQESEAIRAKWSWSVPTHAALAAAAKCSPIMEIGAGNGHWANLLRKCGADVVAYDGAYAAEASPASIADASNLMGEREEGVEEGGPERAAEHPTRALLLSWPDYQGRGSYSTQCLAAYTGDTLLLLGEWRGRTLGSSTPELGEDGQAFAPAFQRAVEAQFEVSEEHRLPSWPLFVDTLTIWRRRGGLA